MGPPGPWCACSTVSWRWWLLSWEKAAQGFGLGWLAGGKPSAPASVWAMAPSQECAHQSPMSGLSESPRVREVGAETGRLGKADRGPGRVVSVQDSPLWLTFQLPVLSPPLPTPSSVLPHCPASNPCPRPLVCPHPCCPPPPPTEGPGLPAAVAEGLRGCLREQHLTVLSGATQVSLDLPGGR